MSEIHRIREAVFARADGLCECGCGRGIEYATGRLDHCFGRGAGRPDQAVSNCWALAIDCDENRTANRPSSSFWKMRMVAHFKRHGYHAEAEMALAQLGVLRLKGFAPP